jgi:hypothetical protein
MMVFCEGILIVNSVVDRSLAPQRSNERAVEKLFFLPDAPDESALIRLRCETVN